MLKNVPQRLIKFGISAVDRETGERICPVFWTKARNEKAAIKKAIITLSGGKGFIPETAEIWNAAA